MLPRPINALLPSWFLRLPGIDGRSLSQMTTEGADNGLLPLEQWLAYAFRLTCLKPLLYADVRAIDSKELNAWGG